MSERAHFGPELFGFLRELRENNSKEWFQANRARYIRDVRDPFLNFIADFGPYIKKINRNFVADPRPVGGSMFRIHRDTRFSRDKSPYKTNLGASFYHTAGEMVHAPGYYLHLEPGEVFAAVGIWRPDGETLAKVRDAIVAKPSAWRAVVSDTGFHKFFTIQGDVLKRPPRGYDPEHELIEDIKRKDFTALAYFSEAETCAPSFIERFSEACKAADPFSRFLTIAVGLEW